MNLFQAESPFGNGTVATPQVYDQIEALDISQGSPIVFIVDADQAACKPLAALVTRKGWRPVVFASGEECLAHPVELAPACMILDMFLPGMSGLELQRRVAAEHPHIATIFLSAQGDIPAIVEAMKAGALEFFEKPFQAETLVSAIQEALGRSRTVVAKEAQRKTFRRCFASLTRREREVMALVCSGLSNKLVGTELGISEITVKAHRGQVMQKMQASSLADLVKIAGKLGLAKSRQTAISRDHSARVSDLSGQLIASYACVA